MAGDNGVEPFTRGFGSHRSSDELIPFVAALANSPLFILQAAFVQDY